MGRGGWDDLHSRIVIVHGGGLLWVGLCLLLLLLSTRSSSTKTMRILKRIDAAKPLSCVDLLIIHLFRNTMPAAFSFNRITLQPFVIHSIISLLLFVKWVYLNRWIIEWITEGFELPLSCSLIPKAIADDGVLSFVNNNSIRSQFSCKHLYFSIDKFGYCCDAAELFDQESELLNELQKVVIYSIIYYFCSKKMIIPVPKLCSYTKILNDTILVHIN